MQEKYYDVKLTDTKKYRLFKEDVEEEELMWHQDEWDREIVVLDGKNWKIQFDNELPIVLNVGDVIQIQNHIYHRIIKGNDNLVIKIIEINKK
jgi:quercetin dioxygenase-like cupin family protein